jgi:hypothetical protein
LILKERIDMNRMERRRFLATAGATTAAVASFFYPGAADAAFRRLNASKTVLPDPLGPDPTYAGGEVVSKNASGVVLATPATTRAVRIPSDRVVWKEFEGDFGLIDLRDWVDVKGEPQVDGSLLATSGMIFVNIGRRDGFVHAISHRGVGLTDAAGRSHSLEFSSRLEVIDSADGTPLPNSWMDLPVGIHVGAVGLLLSNGGFRATRIWK